MSQVPNFINRQDSQGTSLIEKNLLAGIPNFDRKGLLKTSHLLLPKSDFSLTEFYLKGLDCVEIDYAEQKLIRSLDMKAVMTSCDRRDTELY